MSETTLDPFRTEPADDTDAHDNWTSIGGEDSRWYHRDWTIEEAKTGAFVTAFLEANPDDVSGWMAQDMKIEDDDGNPVGYLVHPDRLAKIYEFEREIADMKEQPKDGLIHPAVHGPYSGGDNMLVDTESIRTELALVLARLEVKNEPRPERCDDAGWEAWRAARAKRAAEIEEEDSSSLIGSAVHLAYSMTPYPDERGVIPIRAWSPGDQEDGAEQEARWMLAYTTPARGLFVRAGSPGFFGNTYTVVTGSGYVVRQGFESREVATGFAQAFTEAVPGIDWRTWSMQEKDMPPALLEPLKQVMKEWDQFGRRPQADSA